MIYGYIYETTNLVNGRKYIGKQRCDQIGSFNYLGSGKILKSAIEKYGRDNFEKDIIDYAVNSENLDKLEKYHIEINNALNDKLYYNLTNGGEGGNTIAGYSEEKLKLYKKNMSEKLKGKNKGKHHSEESKLKISLARKGTLCGKDNPFYGKKHSEETLKIIGKKVSETNTGRCHSEETKLKMSLAAKGRKASDEAKFKMHLAKQGINHPNYGKKHSEETINKMKQNNASRRKVKMELEEKIILFDSVGDCSKYLKDNYDLSRGTVKTLLKTGKPLNTHYKRLSLLNGLILSYL